VVQAATCAYPCRARVYSRFLLACAHIFMAPTSIRGLKFDPKVMLHEPRCVSVAWAAAQKDLNGPTDGVVRKLVTWMGSDAAKVGQRKFVSNGGRLCVEVRNHFATSIYPLLISASISPRPTTNFEPPDGQTEDGQKGGGQGPGEQEG
jgi:hypothetical protein